MGVGIIFSNPLEVSNNSKLNGWETKFLSIAGRTTLAKSSLSSIPNYVMQCISLPAKTLKLIDKA